MVARLSPRITLATLVLAVGCFAATTGVQPAAAQDSAFPGLDPAVLEAARQEGALTLYSSQAQDLAETTAKAFEAVLPEVEVSIIRAASGPLANRFATEYEAGVFEADVLNSSNLRIFADHPDWYFELTPELVPTIANWPEEHKKGVYINATQGPQLIAYNPTLVSEELRPKTWEDLLRPEFRGKGMIVDPRSSNTYMNWVNLMYDTYGADFITKLKEQNFTAVEGGSQGTQQVSAGAYMLVFPPSFAHAKPLIDQGAPLAVVYPSENSDVPAIGPQHSWSLPAKAQHPNAARAFLTWLMTEDAQKILCGGNSASVILTDFEGCPKPSANFIPADLDIPQERKDELLRLLGLQ